MSLHLILLLTPLISFGIMNASHSVQFFVGWEDHTSGIGLAGQAFYPLSHLSHRPTFTNLASHFAAIPLT